MPRTQEFVSLRITPVDQGIRLADGCIAKTFATKFTRNLSVRSESGKQQVWRQENETKSDNFSGSIFAWLSGPAAVHAAGEPFFLIPSGNSHTILQYNEEGEFVDAFVPFASTAPLRNPRAVIVGPDGNIYVSSNRTNNPGNAVLRYDGASGNFIDVFARGPLDPFGLVFGPDGYLYATGTNSSNVVRFDGITGAFIDVFASNSANPGTLSGPRGLVFGSDGHLYVTSPGFGNVVRYDISTGNFLGVFATIDSPDFFEDSIVLVSK